MKNKNKVKIHTAGIPGKNVSASDEDTSYSRRHVNCEDDQSEDEQDEY